MKKKYMKPEMTKVVPACPEFLDTEINPTSTIGEDPNPSHPGEEFAKQREGVWGDSRKDLLWDF